MEVQDQIEAYFASQSATKRQELEMLHEQILRLHPKGKLRFLDGKDEKGKVVSNPNIGYGTLQMKYADGKTREFYQIGLSGNTTGISVYIMGLDDKRYLSDTFGSRLGKASVTGYCIKFKSVKDIDLEVLKEVIRFGFAATG